MPSYYKPQDTCYRCGKVSPYFDDLAMGHHTTIYSYDKAVSYINECLRNLKIRQIFRHWSREADIPCYHAKAKEGTRSFLSRKEMQAHNSFHIRDRLEKPSKFMPGLCTRTNGETRSPWASNPHQTDARNRGREGTPKNSRRLVGCNAWGRRLWIRLW